MFSLTFTTTHFAVLTMFENIQVKWSKELYGWHWVVHQSGVETIKNIIECGGIAQKAWNNIY